MKKKILFAAVVAALALPAISNARNYCGSLETNYGPFDYRTDKGHLPIVEHAHFTEEVEQGIRGNTGLLGGDLDYTLRSFPNHHRALVTLARVALRDKTTQIPATKWPVECYFLRAYQFAPNDGVARSTYGAYLYGLGRYDKALAVYKEAIALAPDDAMINYNIGLAYLKKKDYEHALQHAHKAYDMGYPLPGLKNQLAKAGKGTQQADKASKPE